MIYFSWNLQPRTFSRAKEINDLVLVLVKEKLNLCHFLPGNDIPGALPTQQQAHMQIIQDWSWRFTVAKSTRGSSGVVQDLVFHVLFSILNSDSVFSPSLHCDWKSCPLHKNFFQGPRFPSHYHRPTNTTEVFGSCCPQKVWQGRLTSDLQLILHDAKVWTNELCNFVWEHVWRENLNWPCVFFHVILHVRRKGSAQDNHAVNHNLKRDMHDTGLSSSPFLILTGMLVLCSSEITVRCWFHVRTIKPHKPKKHDGLNWIYV